MAELTAEPKLALVKSASRFTQVDYQAAADAYNAIVAAAQELEYLLEEMPNRYIQHGFEGTREGALAALGLIVDHAKRAYFS